MAGVGGGVCGVLGASLTHLLCMIQYMQTRHHAPPSHSTFLQQASKIYFLFFCPSFQSFFPFFIIIIIALLYLLTDSALCYPPISYIYTHTHTPSIISPSLHPSPISLTHSLPKHSQKRPTKQVFKVLLSKRRQQSRFLPFQDSPWGFHIATTQCSHIREIAVVVCVCGYIYIYLCMCLYVSV